MLKRYVIAIDEGTTSARALIYDIVKNEIIRTATKPLRSVFQKPGWVEQDPNEIYSKVFSALSEAVILSNIKPEEIFNIGITNQRETVLLWDADTGEPCGNAIVWQCRRTAKICAELVSSGYENLIKEKTGLKIDPYFSASKIKWMLENFPKAKTLLNKGKLKAGTIDSYLIWRLTNGNHFTDITNASRTMLFNIKSLSYDEELLKIFNIPIEILPKVLPSDSVFGETNIFGKPVMISGVLGDQQAALFGQGCFKTGEGKNTYGTGCFMLLNTGEKIVYSKSGLLTTIAWQACGKTCYALEGSVFNAGSSVTFLKNNLQLIKSSAETEALANSVPDTAGVYVIPAFTGLGAPYWNSDAKGLITGLTLSATKAHLVRAVLESIAYSSKDVLDCMEADSGIKISELKVDGGASANNFLMQFQSDILNLTLKRPKCIESTALGAIFMSGLKSGAFKSLNDILRRIKYDKEFVSVMDGKTRQQKYKAWKDAVKQCLINKA